MKAPWTRLRRSPTYPLRKAWSRFLARLPARHRRSILRFEHFVVLGPAASGKTWLIERYTDWRRQEQQFLPSQPDDPDLPVYLGSSAVVIELPSKILHDHSREAERALLQLFRPLYQRQAPTVVIAIDAARLREASPDALDELAGELRGKINLLAAIRQGPVEVRVVLTRLDEIDGYEELAALYRAQEIPLWLPLAPAGDELRARLDAWIDEARAALPRALTSLGAAEYRRVIAFVRHAPALIPRLHRLLAALFARDALSSDPIAGGLYFGADPPGAPNPLRGAAERGLGRDPRLYHVLAAALLAAGALTLIENAFTHQRGHLKEAEAALEQYHPAVLCRRPEELRLHPGDWCPERERELRQAIVRFTSPRRYWHDMDAYPPFFSGRRRSIQTELSNRIRAELLIPGSTWVAKQGRLRPDEPSLPYRRSLYYLALIHGERGDLLHLTDWRHPGVVKEPWPEMTGLDPELIGDYLMNTGEASEERIPLEISAADHLDRVEAWTSFFAEVEAAMLDGNIVPAELESLSRRAKARLDALDLIARDDLTPSLLPVMEREPEPVSPRSSLGRRIEEAYASTFEGAWQEMKPLEAREVQSGLRRLLEVVRGVRAPRALARCSLHGFTDMLGDMYGQAPAAQRPEALALTIGGWHFELDQNRWEELIRASAADQLISELRRCSADRSIFFEPGVEATLHPVHWNPYASSDSVFTGAAVLDGRYTEAAYTKYVLASVKALSKLLAEAPLPEASEKLLMKYVRAQVSAYATSYLDELKRFLLAFGVNARSPAALRVALAQMSGSGSAFDDYLIAVDANTRLETLGKPGQPDPMLAPIQDLVVEPFARWHGLVGPEAKSSELKEYKAILAQMLDDPPFLERMTGPVPLCPSPQDANARAALAGEAGSYPALHLAWLDSVALPAWQQGPFLAPLCTTGAAPLQASGHTKASGNKAGAPGVAGMMGAVEAGFRRDLLPELRQLVEQFPFNRSAQAEVEPAELEALLHPKKGQLYRIYGDRLPAMMNDRSVPWKVRRTLMMLHELSGRFWDEEGNAKPLAFRVFGVAPAAGDAAGSSVTLQLGGKPLLLSGVSEETLPFAWNAQTELKICPSEDCSAGQAQVTSGPSYWSLLNLINKGTARSTGLYTWEVGREPSRIVGLAFPEDPWRGLDLRWRVRSFR